jgi:hypothetical protein
MILPDLGNGQWNVFSIAMTILMLLIAFIRYSEKKPKLILASVVATLLTYVAYKDVIDTTSGLVYAMTRENPMEYAIQLYGRYWFVFGAIIFAWVFIKYAKIQVDCKSFIEVYILNWGLMIATVLVFGVTNMRMLVDPTLFYWTSFVPMWILWTVGYYFFTRKRDLKVKPQV